MEQMAQIVAALNDRLDHLRNEASTSIADLRARLQQQQEAAAHAAANVIRADTSQRAPNVRIPKPPKFKGVRDGPKILEWVHAATTYLRAAALEHTEAGLWHITNFLDGDAAVWWRLECEKRDRGEAILFPTNWTELKQRLIEQFQIFNHVTDVRDRYTALRQTGTVSSYITKFRALVVELGDEPESSQIYQFLKGLKPEIQARTRTHKPATLNQAMDIADEADRANYHAYKGAPTARNRAAGGGGTTSVPMDIGTVRAASRRTGRGTGQGISEEDQQWPDTSQSNAINGQRQQKQLRQPTPYEMQQLRQENRCFYCRKQGHQARDCMKKKADAKRRNLKTGQYRRKAEN